MLLLKTAIARTLLADFDEDYVPILGLGSIAAPLPKMQTRNGTENWNIDADLVAYPNPAQDELWFEIKKTNPKDAEILIFSSIGQQVARIPVPKASQRFHWFVTDLSSGIYMAQLRCKGQAPVQISFVINHASN